MDGNWGQEVRFLPDTLMVSTNKCSDFKDFAFSSHTILYVLVIFFLKIGSYASGLRIVSLPCFCVCLYYEYIVLVRYAVRTLNDLIGHKHLLIWLPTWLSGKESACQCRKQVGSLDHKDPLEEEMATHSGILAWKIPQTKEPAGLQSMKLQSQTWLSY